MQLFLLLLYQLDPHHQKDHQIHPLPLIFFMVLFSIPLFYFLKLELETLSKA
jgi:hypothetical protein